MPDTFIGTQNTSLNKTNAPTIAAHTFLWKETDKKEETCHVNKSSVLWKIKSSIMVFCRNRGGKGEY